MTTAYHRTAALIGRSAEVAEARRLLRDGVKALVISGASGIGKTAVVDDLSSLMLNGHERYRHVWFHSLYRTSWTSVLAEICQRIPEIPSNATATEMERSIIRYARKEALLLALDNVELSNVEDVANFLEKWSEPSHRSSVVLTAQLEVDRRLPESIQRLNIHGLSNDADVLELFGDARRKFPTDTLVAIGDAVGRNPQSILFLSWLGLADEDELWDAARNLQGPLEFAVNELMGQAGIPALSFLALGIHRNQVVTDALLAYLWDQFGARGAESYVRTRDHLLAKRFLLPAGPSAYRLHESVHVQLEKALVHRIGERRSPSLHHYFAEFYSRALRREPSSANLAYYVYHAVGARNYESLFHTLIEGDLAAELVVRSTELHLREEIERLIEPNVITRFNPVQRARILLKLGALCNDLSDYETTLTYMTMIGEEYSAIEDPPASSIKRESWFLSAVAFSSLGQSDECQRHYYRVIDSAPGDDDHLGCLSLGYLCHDLKYRDLDLAIELGRTAVDWAAEFGDDGLLAKNKCSLAESLVVDGDLTHALALFEEAWALAAAADNSREVGRILTNWGFAESLIGVGTALSRIEKGGAISGSVGDRRRDTQSRLYGAVSRALSGDVAGGLEGLLEASETLRDIRDGRNFVPALYWLLQLRGLDTRHYPPRVPADAGTADLAALLEYATDHLEFRIYHRYWVKYLAPMLVRLTAGEGDG